MHSQHSKRTEDWHIIRVVGGGCNSTYECLVTNCKAITVHSRNKAQIKHTFFFLSASLGPPTMTSPECGNTDLANCLVTVPVSEFNTIAVVAWMCAGNLVVGIRCLLFIPHLFVAFPALQSIEPPTFLQVRCLITKFIGCQVLMISSTRRNHLHDGTYTLARRVRSNRLVLGEQFLYGLCTDACNFLQQLLWSFISQQPHILNDKILLMFVLH